MKSSSAVLLLTALLVNLIIATPAFPKKIMSYERQVALGIARETHPESAPRVPDADGVWSHLSIAGRFGHDAVYDSAHERLVVFGGIDSYTDLNDVWSLSLSQSQPWKPMKTTGTPPPPGGFYASIYQAARGRLVVVGHGNAWALGLQGSGTWVELNPTGTAPPAFSGPGLYDAARDRMLVLDEFANVLYALSLSGTPAWTQQTPAGTAPAARFGASSIVDGPRDRVVMFGGEEDLGPLATDVWALSLSGTPAWTELSTTGAPPVGRFDATAIYDPVRQRMVVYGGSDGSAYFGDAAAITLTGTPAWTLFNPANPIPHGRAGHTSIYDAGRDRMVTFGGEDDDQPLERNDVWALSLSGSPAWTALPGTTPDVRGWHSAVLAGASMVVFGGRNLHSANIFTGSNDAWILSLDHDPFWTELAPAGSPPPARYLHTAVYDEPRRRMLVFGGSAGSDVWALSLHGNPSWTELSPGGTPPPNDANAICDPRRARMLVFSGAGTSVWSLSLSGAANWTTLAPGGTPPSETGRGIYDPVRDRVLIFGNHTTSDVWSLSLSGTPSWTLLTPSGAAPVPRESQSVVYDAGRDRLVIYGGVDSFDSELDDTWALSLGGSPAWVELSPSGSPGLARAGHTAVYDAHNDRMVVFGGEDFYIDFNDVRALTWGKGKAAFAISVPVAADRLHACYPNPFNPRVTIPFELGENADATLAVYDVSGRLVKTLLSEWTVRGTHSLVWDGTSAAGDPVSSGVYFCRLTTGTFTSSRKIVLLK